MRAAVLHPGGGPSLDLRDDVTALGPDDGEVKIQIKATGVCHSDLSVVAGGLPSQGTMIVGHEGAGVVREVGRGVTGVQVGDHVVVNWIPACGRCPDCVNGESHLCMTHMSDLFGKARFAVGETPAFGMAGTGTWAEEIVVPWEAAVRIDDDIPFEYAALLGCGVSTGVGAVINTARVRPGSTVAVLGLGGVGLSVVQGASIAGAARIVAVDPNRSKHGVAMQLGATEVVVPEDLQAIHDDVTKGRGFDAVFEAVGRSDTIKSAWDLTRRGGDTVIVGAGAQDDLVQINAFELLFRARNLRPSVYGSSDLRRDLPLLVALHRQGRLDIESLISRRIRFEELNDAVSALEKGDVIRQVVLFDE
ncbi:Zn-dependent alcohol dehydrogenase [Micromonospora palythoicola]|uniref:Zn-dependent alcohol dehydrogenase n=1 Tax=Micromonospora palythoicola TaxID=3120507 RepID=UPI002FCE16A0